MPKDSAIDTLLSLTEALLRETTLEAALQNVVDSVLDIVPATHASIRLLGQDGIKLMSGARAGAGTEAKPVTLRRGEGLGGWVIENAEPVHVADTKEDPRFVTKPGQGFSIRSIIIVPMFAPDMVVGNLGAVAPDPDIFEPSDLTMLQLVANCAAPAILRARLRRLAVTDHQTRALNQRALFPRLEKELGIARGLGRDLSILLMDLDHFKSVNDQHGHAAGDHVLRVAADRFRDTIRGGDVLVRRGGEEFVVIMANTERAGAVACAERIRAALADTPIEIDDDVTLTQTISIGVATWDGEETAEDLEHRADLAMYDAKRAGRNRVVVSEKESPDSPASPS